MQTRNSLLSSQEPLDSDPHPHLLKVNLTVCSSLPQVSLKVFLTQVVYAYLNPYMRAVRKTSMVLHFKCLMKFRVQELFIQCSVINFVTKYRCVTAINEYRQLGVCSTKHRIWTIYQQKFLKCVRHSKFCQHSLFFRRCKRCTCCIIYFLSPILSLSSSERT